MDGNNTNIDVCEALKEKAVLIDGSGFFYRAYYALPQFVRSDGHPTGAVFGFCSMLLSSIDNHFAKIFAVVLDSSKLTFRNEIYSEYKSNRKETPEDLKVQFPLLRQACEAFGVPVIEKIGFEADDLIATYSNVLSKNGYKVCIISSDKDLLQLLDENISIFDPLKSKFLDEKYVQEKYGIHPSKMSMLQALMGDSSDNIPGVSGVGLKTAVHLLNKYGDLDGIYANIDDISAQKLKNNLINEKELLFLSLQLTTLIKDIDLNISNTDKQDFSELFTSIDYQRLSQFTDKHEFYSLRNRILRKIKSMN